MAKRSPIWTRDELILVLDLYVHHNGNPPGKTSKEVLELSDLLNAMGRSIDGKQDTYRNPAGVYMKAMNFRRFDTAYASTGRSSLTRWKARRSGLECIFNLSITLYTQKLTSINV